MSSDKRRTEDRSGSVVSPDGTEIVYWTSGTGPPLVLAHGSGVSDHRRWEIAGVRPALAEHVTVYALDRRGRGESGDSPEYSLEKEVADVVGVVEAVGEPVALLGHSYGATIALEASLLTDGIARLVLYEPGIAVGDHELAPPEVVAELNDLLEEGENEEALLLFCRVIAGLTPEEIDVFRSDPSWRDRVDGAHTLPREEQAIADLELRPARFAGMTTPTLLLSGGESPRAYQDATAVVHGALANSRIVTFEGHHHVAMQTAPERFVEEVLAFVRETSGHHTEGKSTTTETYDTESEADPKRVVDRWFAEFWGELNPDIVDELAAEDILFHYTLVGEVRGREAVKARIVGFAELFPDGGFELTHEPIAEGEWVVARWEGGGTHTGPAWELSVGTLPANSGRTAHYTGTTVYRVRDGTIAEEHGQADYIAAMQQLGLVPGGDEATD
ncbi:alpha/beta fold hydrolase [Natronorarus salvus]|uniref:alpha/beta fold hydrolase n=1 Tax=Natronorarus salvus TaxID=3117733 RepID=UPI002F2607C5